MVFQPSLEQDATDGFYTLVESLLDDIFHCASLVPRVAKHYNFPDYSNDVEEVHVQEECSRVKSMFAFHLWEWTKACLRLFESGI